MWYSLNDLLSKNRLLSYVIGNRGGGKTFSAQMWCIKDALKNINNDECRHKFIWLRRYESEINQIKNNWCSKDLRDKFSDYEITTKGKKIYVDGEQVGLMVALSTSQRLKSVDFHDYDKIIFDEFLIDKGSLRYINSEVELYLEFFETVNRLSDRVRGLFIANAITIANPYFTYFNIKPDIYKKFTMNEHIAIELYKGDEFVTAKKQTKFGRLVNNTLYGDYSIDNKFLRDDYNFIKERPKDLQYIMTILYDHDRYGCWYEKKENIYYFDNIIENKCNTILCVNVDELEENALYKRSMYLKPRTDILKIFFNEGRIYFSDIVVKKKIFEVLKSI